MFSVISDNMIIFSEENYDFRNLKELTCVEIRRLRGGFQSYSDLALELAVSRDAA